jgi:hypothetical protein
VGGEIVGGGTHIIGVVGFLIIMVVMVMNLGDNALKVHGALPILIVILLSVIKIACIINNDYFIIIVL